MAPASTADIVSFPKFAKPVPREQFIDAMGQAVTGVTIITTSGGAGRAGITVSAVSSVTADPPVLLACIHRDSPACDKVRRNGIFASTCSRTATARWRISSLVAASATSSKASSTAPCGAAW